MELLVAKIQAIEILNSLPTDVTAPHLCQIFKAKLEMVNITMSEEGVPESNVGFICDLANGLVPLTPPTTRSRSSSDDSYSSDETMFGAKSRLPDQNMESTTFNWTESINSSESESEEDNSESEQSFTTSHARTPTIDLTRVEMSECDINEKPPSKNQCDINEKPRSLKTIDLTDVGMTTSEKGDIISNNGPNISVDFNTAKLLDRMEEILSCPISQMRIQDPLCGPDMVTYENKSITKWLSTRQSSPMIRIPMTMRYLIGNNVIKDIIAAMDEYNIRD